MGGANLIPSNFSEANKKSQEKIMKLGRCFTEGFDEMKGSQPTP
jgi:hypothetical protein